MIQSNRTHATPVLSIRLLGSFGLYYDEYPLNTLNTARLQSLLAYLLLHREAPISRQSLAFLFWPDSSETQARTNLRNLLYKLRSALPEADRYIVIDQHTIQWQAATDFILDVDQFISCAGRTTSIQDLKQAIQLYAGDFMPDCYEDWAQTLRESLRQTYINTLDRLLLLLVESQRQQEALEYAQVLLRQEPTREETYGYLMGLYAQRGDRASIARIYQTCVTVLERELGIDPSPSTEKAYKNAIGQAAAWNFPAEPFRDSFQDDRFHNLPALLTSFVGRGQELEHIKTLLSQNRLVTLNGPGGIGKTRLALAAARELVANYRDGICMVDLASVNGPEMVITAIADALHASDEVRTAGLDGLINLLRDQNLLLFLDNCEHLTGRVGEVSLALLQACPDMRVITTSREPLNVYGEIISQVPALPVPALINKMDLQDLPSQTQALWTNESVELFIERAKSALPTFQPDTKALWEIADICQHLEGIPLAIEMAAGRVKTLGVHQIVERLDNMLELLKASSNAALPRHQTMQAVMDWSYDMLAAPERELFTRLSVFSGHFSLEAAEKICSGNGITEAAVLELLASLVDKSLVGAVHTLPEARFRLHEIARQYGHQKLELQEQLLHWQNRHLDYFVHLAEEAEPKLRGAEQLEWLNRLELEQENVRAALRLALGEAVPADTRRADLAGRLASALWLFWFIRGHFSEARGWTEQAVDALEGMDRPSRTLGKVLYTAASFSFFQGDFSQAKFLSRKSMRECKAHKDIFGQVISCHHLGLIASTEGNPAQAYKYLNRGLKLATQLEDAWLIAVLRSDLAALAITVGDPDDAGKQFQQSLEISRRLGDTFQILYSLTNLANLAIQQGELQQAAILTEESLSLSQLIGERRGISFALQNLGRIAMQQKQYRRASALLKQSLRVLWGTRDRETVVDYLVHLAACEVQEERFEIAARILAASEAALTSFPAGYRLLSQPLYDHLVETIQTRLGPGVFTAAWTLGRLMSLEQAVSFALMDHSSGAGSFASR